MAAGESISAELAKTMEAVKANMTKGQDAVQYFTMRDRAAGGRITLAAVPASETVESVEEEPGRMMSVSGSGSKKRGRESTEA